jgi:hypothetical protein
MHNHDATDPCGTQKKVLHEKLGPEVLPAGLDPGVCVACKGGRHDHCGAQVGAAGIRCKCMTCWGSKGKV